MRFDERSEKARFIMEDFMDLLTTLTMRHEVHFEVPHCDMARRFLDEIKEFKAVGD